MKDWRGEHSLLQLILKNLRWDIVLLVFLFMISCRLILLPFFWPNNDTLFSFQTFYGLYSNYFYHRELGIWFPMAAFGIPAAYWLLSFITPSLYFFGFLGGLFRFQNALTLFKSAVFFEHLLLMADTYLLAKTFLKSRASLFFVCLAASASSLWLFQINWNFRIFYLLPFLFYLISRFFDTLKAWWIWIAGTVFILSELGVPAYFVTLHFFIVLCFFIYYWIKHPAAPLSLFRFSPPSLISLMLFILSLVSYLAFAFSMFDGIITHQLGRSSASYTVSISDFLTYSPGLPLIGAHKFLGLFFGDYQNVVGTFYFGLLPLAFILYALFQNRHPMKGLLLFFIVFLSLFSLGDPFGVARLLYWIYPPIRYFRYIGLMAGLLRFFLILLAGLGLDQYVDDLRRRDLKTIAGFKRPQFIFFVGAFMIFLAALGFSLLPVDEKLFYKHRPDFFYFGLFLFGMAALFLVSRSKRLRTLKAGALLFFALDLLSYQQGFLTSWPHILSDFHPQLQSVYDFKFQAQRTLPPQFQESNPRAKEAFRLTTKSVHHLHTESQNFMLFDSCLPLAANFHLSEGAEHLIGLRYSRYYDWAQNQPFMLLNPQVQASPAFQDMKKTLGCSPNPKLRWVEDPVFVPNKEAAERLLKQGTLLGANVVIEAPASKTVYSTGSELLGPVSYSFNHLSFNTKVSSPGGAWLYYADSFHPYWRAKIDGKTVPLYRANRAFKALLVPLGAHRITFEYSGGFSRWALYWLVLMSVLFSAAALVGMVALCGPVKIIRLINHNFASRKIKSNRDAGQVL